MRPISVTVGPLATANAALLASSATPVSGTPLTLLTNTLDTPRRIILTAGSEAAQRTLVLVGTSVNGDPIGETLTIPATTVGAVQSVLSYKTLTSATPLGGGWTAAATLGTNTVASSRWIFLDSWGFSATALQVTVSGTVNYTVEQTLDNPNNRAPLPVIAPAAVTWLPHPVLAGLAVSAQDNYAFVPQLVRLTLNSGTGSATLTVIQAAGPLRSS